MDAQTDSLDGSAIIDQVLGEAADKLRLFHSKLSQEGLNRGIIGPRDTTILWERHILNSAAVLPAIRAAVQEGAPQTIADVGSGGGFPGIVVAACLPQYSVTLIEPMERRVQWLQELVDQLDLTNVQIVRARAEELIAGHGKAKKASSSSTRTGSMSTGDADHMTFGIVTCRAVAPMTKLAAWTLPLVARGGQLIALKGQSAQAEIDKAAKEIRKYGGRNPRVVDAPVGPGLQATHLVIVDKMR